MNSRVIAAIAAAVLAIIGIGAVVAYAVGARNAAYDGAEMVKVWRVATDIDANSDSATVKDNVEQVSIPNAAVAKNTIRDLKEIDGLKTVVKLVAGEQLIKDRFDKEGAKAAADVTVPAGLQEVAVLVDAAAGVSERVDNGVKVGVIGLVEDGDNKRGRMFAQNILVTDVEKKEDGTMVVTLAVNTQQATQIATAAQFGQVRLAVQNDETSRDGASSIEAGSLVK